MLRFDMELLKFCNFDMSFQFWTLKNVDIDFLEILTFYTGIPQSLKFQKMYNVYSFFICNMK